MEYDKAKSVCSCGHLGDGPSSEHGDTFSHGHGPCMVEGCDCHKFTWVKFTPEFEATIKRQ